MEWSKYRALLGEYDEVLATAKASSASLVGARPSAQFEGYAEQIFVKLLAHCITLRHLSPHPERKPGELWDLASVSVIARSIIEAYDALAYVALGELSTEEREFRILLWELHDTNRRCKMLEAIGSSDPQYFEIALRDQKLHERVMGHALFARLGKTVQKKIEAREPPHYSISQRERCLASRVNYDYYNAATMQLSQYVHTLPFAIHQLFAFKASSPEALHLMSLPVQYALSFLCRAIEGLRQVFPTISVRSPPPVERAIAVWSGVVERGVRNGV
jgi:hypothetical protein